MTLGSYHSRENSENAAKNALAYMGFPSELSILVAYRILIDPRDDMDMRDLESLLGYFVLFAEPDEETCTTLRSVIDNDVLAQRWDCIRRGGYLLELLCFFPSSASLWQDQLSPWLDALAKGLPTDLPRATFYPGDSRNVPGDELARRWHLSAGVLYDRLKRRLAPPYVC